MKALILVNGELYKPDVLKNRIGAATFDLVLGTDGGARHSGDLKVTVNAIVGDMDSITDSDRSVLPDSRFISSPPEKDETDLELALLYAVQQGVGHIVTVGMMGGRMDMTFANILLLTDPRLSSCRIEVWHGDQTGWIIRPPGGDIVGNPGDTVSLIPLGGFVSGIGAAGLEYPVTDNKLNVSPARGISNVLDRTGARITLSEGIVLAVHTPGKA